SGSTPGSGGLPGRWNDFGSEAKRSARRIRLPWNGLHVRRTRSASQRHQIRSALDARKPANHPVPGKTGPLQRGKGPLDLLHRPWERAHWNREGMAMSPRVMTIVARAVIALWAGYWTFFCIASAIGEREGWLGALMHQVPAVVMVASAVLAWRWPRPAGALLLAEGLFVASGLWVHPTALLFAMLGLPPIVAGILFLIAGLPARG